MDKLATSVAEQNAAEPVKHPFAFLCTQLRCLNCIGVFKFPVARV